MKHAIARLVALVLVSAPVRSPAQSPPPAAPLDSGTIVRLQTSSRWIEGRLLRPATATSDAYVLCLTPRVDCTETTNPKLAERVARGDVTKVQVQRGNRMSNGVRIGAVAGALLGLGVASVGNALSDCECRANKWRTYGAGAAVGALFGMAVGALIGGVTPAWADAP